MMDQANVLVMIFKKNCYRFRGSYLGQDVAIKVIRSDHLNESLLLEFHQEVSILK